MPTSDIESRGCTPDPRLVRSKLRPTGRFAPWLNRHGNLVVLATVLCVLILVAVSSLSYVTSADSSSSARLVRELKASALAESIAVTAEARANTAPWSKRFWAPLPPAASNGASAPSTAPVRLVFSRSGHEFPTVDEGLEREDYDYVGVVKDTSDALHLYRIYVEVTWQGDRYTFSWDKRFEETLMGAANRDATLVDKRIEDPGASTASSDTSPLDQLIDTIKKRAKAPVPGSEEDKNKTVLSSLESDTDSYSSATAVAAEPTEASPTPPSAPVRPPKGSGSFPQTSGAGTRPRSGRRGN